MKGHLTSWVTGRISRPLLASYGRESSHQRRLLANPVQHINGANVADVVCDLELAIGTGTFGVNDTLRDTLTVEVSQQVDEVKVLQQQGAWLLAEPLPAGRVLNGAAIRCCVDRLLAVAICWLIVGDHLVW